MCIMARALVFAAGAEPDKCRAELPARLKPTLRLGDAATHVIDGVRNVSAVQQPKLLELALAAAAGSHKHMLAASVAG